MQIICLEQATGNSRKMKLLLDGKKLAKEGTVLPSVRMMDYACINPKEFYILAYENVLYREEVEQVDEKTFEYLLGKLEETVRAKYAEICDACDRKEDLRGLLYLYKFKWFNKIF